LAFIPAPIKTLIARAADSLGYEIRRKGSPVPYSLEVAYENRASFFRFRNRSALALRDCPWGPHPEYSVFTQYDRAYYLSMKEEFLLKYKTFWAVANTCGPEVVIELGTHAGSGADAYCAGALSAGNRVKYYGFDLFDEGAIPDSAETWRPFEVATALLTERGYDFELIRADLRALKELPVRGDFVAVDAAHDRVNALLDMRLALTADPTYIWIDDYAGEVKEAAERFLADDVKERLDFMHHFDYVGGGGLLVALKK
jgi:hypothetical protein